MKFEHKILRGNLSHIGLETEGLYCFYCTTPNFERELPKLCTVHLKFVHLYYPFKRTLVGKFDRSDSIFC